MSKALQEFLDAAKRQGASDESLVTFLRGRGWPEEDVPRTGGPFRKSQRRSRSGIQAFRFRERRIFVPAEFFHARDMDDWLGIGDVYTHRPLDPRSAQLIL